MPSKSPVPPQQRIEAALRERIADMQSGDQLASIGDLAQEYGASRRTVGKVLARLGEEGLITVWPSYGTFKA